MLLKVSSSLIYEDKRDLRKKKKRLCESLRETETEVTVVDENEIEGSEMAE
jgi:hypothetical protein